MSTIYAADFSGIPGALVQNDALRSIILKLIAAQPMAGKVTEGGSRLQTFRGILGDLAEGKIDLQTAFRRTETELPRSQSIHAASNRVFAANWAERLVRTQYSRFYNQAVMETLLAEGQTHCFVPHSAQEDSSSNCSRQLAGTNHSVRTLYDLLRRSYEDGVFGREIKIPDHPHCTHVITPPQS